MSTKIDVKSGDPYRGDGGKFGTSPEQKLKDSFKALEGKKFVGHDDNKKKIDAAKKDAEDKLATLRDKSTIADPKLAEAQNKFKEELPKKAIFHGTDKNTAESIKKSGFKSSTGEDGDNTLAEYGAGVYLTDDRKQADYYASVKDGQPATLELSVTGNKVWDDVQQANQGLPTLVSRLQNKYPDGIWSKYETGDPLKGKDWLNGGSVQYKQEVQSLRDEGYDVITFYPISSSRVYEKKKDFSYTVVKDPKQITVKAIHTTATAKDNKSKLSPEDEKKSKQLKIQIDLLGYDLTNAKDKDVPGIKAKIKKLQDELDALNGDNKNSDANWKPSVTKAEADKATSESKYKGVLLHGTSTEASKSIAKDGFDLNQKSSGRWFGNGVYFTNHMEAAREYAKMADNANGKVIFSKLNTANPFMDSKAGGFSEGAFQYGKENGIISKSAKSVDEPPIKKWHEATAKYADHLLETHDAIIIKDYFGKDMVIVKDPKQIYSYSVNGLTDKETRVK